MKRMMIPAVALLVFMAAVATAGQQPEAPTYDIQKEMKVKGTVTELKDYLCPVSGTVGTHIFLKTAEATIEAHVASAKFLPEYGIKLVVGDELEITGMKTKLGDKDALLVRRIQRGNEIFSFRDKKGRPLW
jgi:DNA/RNA endonuclease YhcR with UshA esterase domain